MREDATDIVDSVYANFVAYYETYTCIGLVISRRTVRTIHMYILNWDGIIFANMI